MDKLADLLMSMGLVVPIIAIATVILTGILKIPIKILADKTSCPKKITRYIIFLPVILGFGLTALFEFVESGILNFEDVFYNTWFSSVSLSLAIYALLEQFVPSEKKILSKAEIEANQFLVDELKNKLTNIQTKKEEDIAPSVNEEQAVEQSESLQAPNHRRIIITNDKNSK